MQLLEKEMPQFEQKIICCLNPSLYPTYNMSVNLIKVNYKFINNKCFHFNVHIREQVISMPTPQLGGMGSFLSGKYITFNSIFLLIL